MKKIILIIICFFISGCHKEEIPNELANLLIETKATIPVFSEVSFTDLITGINMEVKFDNIKVNTEKIGVYNQKVKYEYKEKTYSHDYTIEVIDEIAPFIFGSINLTRTKNTDINLCETISYGDNYDSKPKCEILGDYDTSKIGTYNLKMIVTDQSNNQTTKNVKLKIVEKTGSSSSNSSTKLDFETVKKKYLGNNITFGIDVSSWQGVVDYEAAKNAGITFVMIRIGYESSDGTIKMDSYYKENIAKAKAAGLKVGIYLYSNANSIASIIKQTSWIINELNGEKLDLPIVFDWENWSTFNKYQLSFRELNNLANLFVNQINATGIYQGAIYSSKYYLETIWNEAKVNPVWLAHYTEQTNYQGDYFMWQLSNIGRIPGIKGDVDLNILYE